MQPRTFFGNNRKSFHNMSVQNTEEAVWLIFSNWRKRCGVDLGTFYIILTNGQYYQKGWS